MDTVRLPLRLHQMKKVKKKNRKASANHPAKRSPARNGKVIRVPLTAKKNQKKKVTARRGAVVHMKRNIVDQALQLEAFMLNFPKITHRRLTVN